MRREKSFKSINRRDRGSVLVIVVALLTLVALIGTALIATARIDRYSAQAHVQAAKIDAIRNGFVIQATGLAEDAIQNDKTRTVDSPRVDIWLADRLPERNPASGTPVWRYITGWLSSDPAVAAQQTDADAFQPPLQVNSTSPQSPATIDRTTSYIKMTPVAIPTVTGFTSPIFYMAQPTSISITYPSNHPETNYQNKTRTFPALQFCDNGGTVISGALFMAADADGDGIADSVLFKLSPTPIDGVTYYCAVRIVDNNSAVNVNTAWSRDHDYTATGVATIPTGFFTSGVGLYELLSEHTDTGLGTAGTNRLDADNEMVALNQYRLGYNTTAVKTPATDEGGWCDPFEDYTTAHGGTRTDPDIQTMVASTTPIEDADPNTTYGNGNIPSTRSDFVFTGQQDGFAMQLGRRIDNPGFNVDPLFTPAASNYFGAPVAGTPFQYHSYSLSDASTAALAYRFCMIDPDAQPTDLELRLRMSAYESAPNYTDYYRVGKLPGYGFSGDTSVTHWKSFPANEVSQWFQYLDYQVNNASPANSAGPTMFTPASGVTFATATPANSQFRSVRPLLTGYSLTSSLIDTTLQPVNSYYHWDRSATIGSRILHMLHPGMLSTDMTVSSPSVASWAAGTHQIFEMVRDTSSTTPASGLTYMCMRDDTTTQTPWDNTLDPNTGVSLGETYWSAQPVVTGKVLTNVNIAGFPELWRAYFSTMYQSTAGLNSIDGGTPFDSDYFTEVGKITGLNPTTLTMDVAFYPSTSGPALVLYDIYRGMHWSDDYTDPSNPTFTPVSYSDAGGNNASLEENSLRMFRSPIRDPRPVTDQATKGLHRLTPYQMMVMRSAIAGINTKQLLAHTPTQILAKTFTLYDVDSALPGASATPSSPVPQYEVTVYGNVPQPFITEVFASNDDFSYSYQGPPDSTGTLPPPQPFQNQYGYVAVELYNPSGTAIPLDNFVLASVSRSAGDFSNGHTTITSVTPLTGLTLPANTGGSTGYLVLESYDPANPDEPYGYRPPAAAGIGGAPTDIDKPMLNHFPMKALAQFIGQTVPIPPAITANNNSTELVLLRRRSATASPNVEDLVPVDQFDFTGFPQVKLADPKTSWHYCRNTDSWYYVYPGRYDASVNPALNLPRHQGVQRTPGNSTHTYSPSATNGDFDPWLADSTTTKFDKIIADTGRRNSFIAPNPYVTMGGPSLDTSGTQSRATYENANGPVNRVSIQLANVDMPGRHVIGLTGNLYPFGGFARLGDILQVPFIGAYRIRELNAGGSPPANGVDPGTLANASNVIVEMNSISMDAAFAEDTNLTNNDGGPDQENVGRFAPDNQGHYDWAKSLFNFLTVRGPSLDYLPDTSPYNYTPGNTPNVTKQPQPVANRASGTVATANDTTSSTEDQVGVQGLININTAPARVLASLPMVPLAATGAIDWKNTESLAQAIVTYRNTGVSGADFKSIFDLNKVPNFQVGGTAAIIGGGSDPTDYQGDFSGQSVNSSNKGDGVRFDFEEQYLMMNRISNLVTTKSDTYTVYILIQGWREAGTPFPALDWEKRVAYIMDRSTGKLTIVPVPTD